MANRKDIDSMLTVSDVARLLSVHINTVRRWSNQGILRVYRVGSRGDRRFQREDIASFLSQESKIAEVRKGENHFFDRTGSNG
jgi:excisionase family DNA binding protein